MRGVVELDAVQELLAALRVLNVLDPEVDPLLDISVPDDLVNDDADSVWCNIVDNTSTTRVDA